MPDLQPGRYAAVPADKTAGTPDEIASLARDAVDFEVASGERKQIEVKSSN